MRLHFLLFCISQDGHRQKGENMKVRTLLKQNSMRFHLLVILIGAEMLMSFFVSRLYAHRYYFNNICIYSRFACGRRSRRAGRRDCRRRFRSGKYVEGGRKLCAAGGSDVFAVYERQARREYCTQHRSENDVRAGHRVFCIPLQGVCALRG